MIDQEELSDDVYEQMTSLCAKGDSLQDASEYDRAIEAFRQAFALLPAPAEKWLASTWILVAIAESMFLKGDYESAKPVLSHALLCPDAIGNPFIHLRFGQVLFELGNDQAKEELARAYIGGGKEIFAEEDPKYFEYVKTVLLPPSDGEW